MQMDEFVLSTNAVANLAIGKNRWEILPAVHNEKHEPSRFQFRYDPLFIPEVAQDGRLAVCYDDKTGFPVVGIRVYIDTEDAQRNAFEQLKVAYSEHQTKLSSASVFARRIIELNVEVSSPSTNVPKFKLLQNRFYDPRGSFTINFELEDRQQVNDFSSWLPHLLIELTYTFSAKKAKQNTIRVSAQDIRNSEFGAQLNGLGTTAAYVHRDDLRNLMRSVIKKMQISAVIEDPAGFEMQIVSSFLQDFTKDVTADVAFWTPESTKSTFNASDLNPSQLTKYLNSMFKKEQDKDQWKHTGNFNFTAKASLVELLTGETSMGGGFTTEGLREKLREHGIHVEFDNSNIIIPKSIQLQQINLAKLRTSADFLSATTYVSDAQSGIGRRSLSLQEMLVNKAYQPDIDTRVQTLESLNLGQRMHAAEDGFRRVFPDVTNQLTLQGTSPRVQAQKPDGKKAFQLGYSLREMSVIDFVSFGEPIAIRGPMKVFGDYQQRTFNTIYQAETDGFVAAVLSAPNQPDAHAYLLGYVGNSNPPDMLVAGDGIRLARAADHNIFVNAASLLFPVKRGNYYKVDLHGWGPSNKQDCYFVPMGLPPAS